MKTNIDVLFFIEHVDRELETAVTIKENLSKDNDIKIIIASSVYHPIYCVLKYKPKVIITPSTSFGKGSPGWLFYNLYGNNIRFINLNYEQFISSWKGSYKSGKHIVSIKQQIHLCWGEYFRDFLIKNNTEPSHIHVTGRPLNTLLKEKYLNKNFKNELSNDLKINNNKTWNFIALTDGLAFVKEDKIKYIIKNGANELGLRNHIKHVKNTLNLFLKWIESISKLHDEIFIIRPHPSISVKEYEDYITDIIGYIPKNIFITKHQTAQKWLVSSERFFTNYSTLTIDSTILEKEFFIINPIKNTSNEDYWWTKNGYEIKTYEDFQSILNSETKTIIKKDLTNFYIDFSLDGISNSTKIIRNSISTNDFSNNIMIHKLIKLLLISPKRLFGSIIRLVFMNLNYNPFGIVKKGIVPDYFNIKEINK